MRLLTWSKAIAKKDGRSSVSSASFSVFPSAPGAGVACDCTVQMIHCEPSLRERCAQKFALYLLKPHTTAERNKKCHVVCYMQVSAWCVSLKQTRQRMHVLCES